MLRPFLLILGLSLLNLACSKIELSDDKASETTPSVTPGQEEKPGGGGEDETPGQSDTLSVAQALLKAPGQAIHVKGFIVGYINGTSLSQYRFALPAELPNTNFLLADSPYETDIDQCMPIGLNKSSAFRPTLNLLDHPEHYRRAIVLSGNTSTYFGVTGIRNIIDYRWTTIASEDTDKDTPGIHPDETFIEQGRSAHRPALEAR